MCLIIGETYANEVSHNISWSDSTGGRLCQVSWSIQHVMYSCPVVVVFLLQKRNRMTVEVAFVFCVFLVHVM